MAETAAHLVEQVIPQVVRQWVVSFPIPLRHLFATQPFLLLPVLQDIHRALLTFVFHQAGLTHAQAQTGTVILMEEDTEIPYLTDPDPTLAPLHAAACTYRIALGPPACQKVLTWKDPSLRLATRGAAPTGLCQCPGV